MTFVKERISLNKGLTLLILWLRGLFKENKLPYTLLLKLNSYTPELSKSVPDLKAINKCLENDINYLNTKEELIADFSKIENNKKAQHIIKQKHNLKKVRKYYSVKIVKFQDIVEVDSIIDRVFVLDISMDLEHPGFIYRMYKKNADYIYNPFYYSVRLSSLVNRFKLFYRN